MNFDTRTNCDFGSFHKIHIALPLHFPFYIPSNKESTIEQASWAFQVASTKCSACNTKKFALQS